jgi:heme/copper-type cytochrome/quinol oxidase subunit 3
MITENQHLEALQDIKKIMERSSRFLSLSGLSGIAAGILALAGAFAAKKILAAYYANYSITGQFSDAAFHQLKVRLLLVAAVVLGAALLAAFYFTRRRAKKNNLPVWDSSSRKLVAALLIPLIAGGIFILSMLQYSEWRFVAPGCLIFYGLALVNASKYTLTDVKYLGLLEIVLGLVNTQFTTYGLYFWAVGFGILHITYGIIMWMKYERNEPLREK